MSLTERCASIEAELPDGYRVDRWGRFAYAIRVDMSDGPIRRKYIGEMTPNRGGWWAVSAVVEGARCTRQRLTPRGGSLNSGKPMTVRPLRRMSHAEETVSIQAVLPDGWIAKSRNLCLCGRSTCGPHAWDIEDAWTYGVAYGCVTEMTMHRGFMGDIALADPDKPQVFATAVEAALWVVHRWRELNAREG